MSYTSCQNRLTFIFRRRVMMPTASADSGTGEPIPMSCPVSRGSNLVDATVDTGSDGFETCSDSCKIWN